MSYIRESGIYQIRHRDSGKCYVGSAVSIAHRWWGHRKRLALRNHHSAHLQNAWNKYGAGAFDFTILERVDRREDLIAREQFWIDRENSYEAGYNMRPTAGSPFGVKHSAETRAKMSAAGKGRKLTPEHCALISERVRRKGVAHLHTPDVRAKAAAVMRGRAMPDAVKKVLSDKRLGMKLPPEWCAAISAAQRGKKKAPRTEEHCARLAASATGRTPSVETRQRMSVVAKLRGAPQLTREQIERGAKKRTGAKRSLEQIARMRAGRLAALEARAPQ